VEAELGGVKVAVFHTGIDVRAQRITKAGDALERPGAVAVAREIGPGAAGTAAGVAAEPAAEVAVEQSVGHQGLYANVIADAEIARGRSRPGGRPHIRDQRRAYAEALDLGSFVTGFTLEPDDAELVADERVHVVTGLIFHPIAIVVSRAVVED